jgi:hypothetical protein
LPADELASWRFYASTELADVLPEHMSQRVRAALEVVESGRSAVYLELGEPVGDAPDDASVHRPTLLLLKGSPGTGKSTIAREVGRKLGWPVIDKDVVRDLLPDELGGLSYEAMLGFAERQLGMGLSVVAASPLGYGRSYERAMETGERTGARVLVLECECSDPVE